MGNSGTQGVIKTWEGIWVWIGFWAPIECSLQDIKRVKSVPWGTRVRSKCCTYENGNCTYEKCNQLAYTAFSQKKTGHLGQLSQLRIL